MLDAGPLHRPPSLTDAVVAHIRDGIIRGLYAPGRQLGEAQLAEELGTSRGTVREAMRELASLGLVSRAAHRGAVVTPLTPRRAEEIYTLRAALESFAARRAVERGGVDEASLADLARHVGAIRDAGAAGDIGGMVKADMDFHSALSALAGHELLMEHLEAIQAHSRRLLVYSELYQPEAHDAGIVVARHERLMEVLRAGDPAAVVAAVEDHISSTGRTIVERMAEIAASDARGGTMWPGEGDDAA
jgi:DNA-binding GntR family transcriptional regulator